MKIIEMFISILSFLAATLEKKAKNSIFKRMRPDINSIRLFLFILYSLQDD